MKLMITRTGTSCRLHHTDWYELSSAFKQNVNFTPAFARSHKLTQCSLCGK